MNSVKRLISWFIESGVTPHTLESESRYIRFLNATLFIFGQAQIPILSLLLMLGMYKPILVNLLALSLFVIGFILNRRGRHLLAKIVIISVMIINTAYFTSLIGSSAPTHMWLIPVAVLGLLVFKPAEWLWASVSVSLSMACFLVFEYALIDLTPVIRPFSDPEQELVAAQSSTLSAIGLTLVLIGMMHRRFVQSEKNLSLEKAQSDRLLRAILPDDIATELRQTGSTPAIRHEDVSILFADIVGFTPLAASMPAEEVVALLAQVFKRFDHLIMECKVEKIKTIGDAYMVAGGVPKSSSDHAERLAQCACGMLAIMKDFSVESGHHLRIRIGLHRGPAVAGVIGTTKFTYDLWGETVNLASRLESSGEPGRIHVSDQFREGLEHILEFEERGEINLKGVGPTRTHWLVS